MKDLNREFELLKDSAIRIGKPWLAVCGFLALNLFWIILLFAVAPWIYGLAVVIAAATAVVMGAVKLDRETDAFRDRENLNEKFIEALKHAVLMSQGLSAAGMAAVLMIHLIFTFIGFWGLVLLMIPAACGFHIYYHYTQRRSADD